MSTKNVGIKPPLTVVSSGHAMVASADKDLPLYDSRDAFYREFGERLSKVVGLIGTKVRAAEITGTSDEMIGKYERGTTKCPVHVAALLATAAGVSIDWLIFGRGAMTVSEGQAEYRGPDYVRPGVIVGEPPDQITFVERDDDDDLLIELAAGIREIYASQGVNLSEGSVLSLAFREYLEVKTRHPKVLSDDERAGVVATTIERVSRFLTAHKGDLDKKDV